MTTETERREANAQIAELVKIAKDALAEAAKVADSAGIEFTFKPAYGMGGTYYPVRSEETNWSSSSDGWSSSNEGWVASSQSC